MLVLVDGEHKLGVLRLCQLTLIWIGCERLGALFAARASLLGDPRTQCLIRVQFLHCRLPHLPIRLAGVGRGPSEETVGISCDFAGALRAKYLSSTRFDPSVNACVVLRGGRVVQKRETLSVSFSA